MAKRTFSLVVAAAFAASSGAEELALDPILITASKTEQPLRNITANVDVITSEDLEANHYASVAEALNSLPGITVTQNGGLGTVSSVFVRGMDTNRMLVFINGIRYQDPSNTSGASFAHLMISDIERIEVIKGPQSGIWGADASAGVINIITKMPEKGTHAGANLEKGSFNKKKWGGYVSHSAETYDVKLSIDRIMSDSFTAQAPRGSDIDAYENDPYANTTLSLGTRVRPTPTDTIGINYTDINALSNYDGYNAPNAMQRSDVRTRLYGLSYDTVSNSHTLSLKANRSTFKRDELDTTYGVKVFEGTTEQIELSDRFGYREDDFLLAGANYETFKADILQADGTEGQKKVYNKALFATNTNTFGTLILTESLRRDGYTNFESKTTGKIGTKYTAPGGLFLGANYGSAYTAPNLIQILNPWGTSNPDLSPENSKGFDLSVGWHNLLVTYFDNRVRDLIQWNGGKYENLDGTSTFKGVELSVHDTFLDAFSWHANYTHLLEFEDKSGQELARRPKREAKAGVDYYGIDNLHIALNALYIGTRYDKPGQKGAQTGRYTLLDAVVNYNLSPTVSLYGKIDNLTDKYYQNVDGYTTSPRAWYVGMKVAY